MRTDFSPLAEAARRHAAAAARAAAPVARANVSVSSVTPITPSTSPAASWSGTEQRWCEWPRVQSLPPFRGIRQALQQIQAIQTRHA